MVLVIIGLMTGLVAINLGTDVDDPEELAADALLRATALASRRAVLQGTPQGLTVTEDGWTVRAFTEDGWRDVESGAYPDRMRVEVSAQGVPLDTGEEPLPVTLWEPTGGAESFEMKLDGRSGDWVLTGDVGGTVAMERPK